MYIYIYISIVRPVVRPVVAVVVLCQSVLPVVCPVVAVVVLCQSVLAVVAVVVLCQSVRPVIRPDVAVCPLYVRPSVPTCPVVSRRRRRRFLSVRPSPSSSYDRPPFVYFGDPNVAEAPFPVTSIWPSTTTHKRHLSPPARTPPNAEELLPPQAEEWLLHGTCNHSPNGC